ncbi:hypothetical protein BASA62_007632 [Batrachochytrium salamandrivorans]|nr:hypothetical protein BASA62_007632 [Batrachochytrium salamandrivorans]
MVPSHIPCRSYALGSTFLATTCISVLYKQHFLMSSYTRQHSATSSLQPQSNHNIAISDTFDEMCSSTPQPDESSIPVDDQVDTTTTTAVPKKLFVPLEFYNRPEMAQSAFPSLARASRTLKPTKLHIDRLDNTTVKNLKALCKRHGIKRRKTRLQATAEICGYLQSDRHAFNATLKALLDMNLSGHDALYDNKDVTLSDVLNSVSLLSSSLALEVHKALNLQRVWELQAHASLLRIFFSCYPHLVDDGGFIQLTESHLKSELDDSTTLYESMTPLSSTQRVALADMTSQSKKTANLSNVQVTTQTEIGNSRSKLSPLKRKDSNIVHINRLGFLSWDLLLKLYKLFHIKRNESVLGMACESNQGSRAGEYNVYTQRQDKGNSSLSRIVICGPPHGSNASSQLSNIYLPINSNEMSDFQANRLDDLKFISLKTLRLEYGIESTLGKRGVAKKLRQYLNEYPHVVGADGTIDMELLFKEHYNE